MYLNCKRLMHTSLTVSKAPLLKFNWDALPSEIYYDYKVKRFRFSGGSPASPQRGTFISRADAIELQRNYLSRITREFVSLAPRIISGEIGVYKEAGELLKKIHLSNTIIEAGGIDRLTQSQLGTIGNILKKQYYAGKDDETGKSYGLKHLFKEVAATPDYSKSMLTNRLTMYAESGKISGSTVKQSIELLNGKTEMKRILGATDAHCEDCLRYASASYQPIGVLPLPKTACRCRTRCLCTVVYR